ncbi:MAG: S-layer homology domain-containing protein [Oscillospiraceae bacterium]|nr:S-layer homology domain-containing protein [Oscillospiraceae bacterium]
MPAPVSKRIISALLLMTALAAAWVSPAAAAAYEPSGWARNDIFSARMAGILPESAGERSFQAAVTRLEFCQTLIRAFEVITGKPAERPQISPFSDTDDASVIAAYALRVVGGYPDGTFKPDNPIKREEIAKMLFSAASAIGADPSFDGSFRDAELVDNLLNNPDSLLGTPESFPSDSESLPSGSDSSKLEAFFNDAALISDWARPGSMFVAEARIMFGSDGDLRPQRDCTREEAFIVIMRMAWRYNAAKLLSFGLFLPAPALNGNDTLFTRENIHFSWTDYTFAAQKFIVTLTDEDGFILYSGEQSSSAFDLTVLSEPSTDDVFGFTKKEQTIHAFVSATNPDGEVPPSSLYFTFSIANYQNSNERFFGDPDKRGFASEAEAKTFMENVTVRIWRLQSDGSKKSGTATIEVNRGAVSDVIGIFESIYNGPERFPIKDVGGFRWGSGTSAHSKGYAIDINYNENYFVSRNGATIYAGSFWRPGDNPYSIKPDGDVVAAFTKYGWGWGGRGWSNGFDYMHFSWDGT